MKHFLIILILLVTVTVLQGQHLEGVTIKAQQHDEPPTQKGQSLYELNYQLEKGSLIVKKYKILNSIVHSEIQVIPSLLVDSLNEQLKVRRSNYVIRRNIAGEQLQPLKIDLDSLTFCQEFQRTKTISTGGFWISIVVNQSETKLLTFKFDSSKPDDFDYQGFLTLYPTFQDKLPVGMPGSHMFNDTFLMQKVEEYFETIQCKDFYYQEFIGVHPERTPRQNRTKEDWNYKEYVKTRNGS